MAKKITVCRVLYDFETNEPNEITLHASSYLQVLAEVNKDWLTGYSRGQMGNFPSAFVETYKPIAIPLKGKVFVCVEQFPELQPGDLAVNPGDLIAGLEPVNADWWRGQLNGEVGIFPLTCVHEVGLKLSTHEDKSAETASLDVAINSVSHSKDVLYQVKAIIDAEAQLNDELTFSAGDIIDVLEEKDADWLIGSCNGKSGIFLRDLTALLSDSQASGPTSASQAAAQQLVATSSTQSLCGQVVYDFIGESDAELSLVSGEIVTNIREVDMGWWSGTCNGVSGLFPMGYVKITESTHTATQPTMQLPSDSPSTASTSAKVLFEFKSMTDEEVSLSKDEQVTILWTNNDWSKVNTSAGVIGLCPTNFLEIQSTTCSSVPVTSGLAMAENEASYSAQQKRPSSVHFNHSLDTAITLEMHKAKVEASKRMSLKVEPEKPPSPKPLHSTAVNAKSKPARPPQMVPRLANADAPLASSPYDMLKEPFGSQLVWRDENLPPSISVNLKTLPAKRPLPKISGGATEHSSPNHHSPTFSSPPPTTNETPLSTTDLSKIGFDQQWNEIQESTKNIISEKPAASLITYPKTNNLSGTTPASPTADEPIGKSPVPVRAAPPIPVRPAPSPPSDLKQLALVPSRPAPSRPNPTRVAPPPPHQPAALVEKLPAAYDEQAANHLTQRIRILEQDIENYNREVETLDSGLEKDDILDEKLRFYMENVNGMTLEVDDLKDKLAEMEKLKINTDRMLMPAGITADHKSPANDYDSNENKLKRKVKRANKIEELMNTEEHYLRDLKLCLHVFNSEIGLQAPEGVDCSFLFCNLPEIIEISEQLLARFKQSTDGIDFEHQLIGEPFLEFKERMKDTYAQYCTKYDDVSTLLEQYNARPDIRSYFNQGLDEIAKHRPEKPFTVDAFLITPVQRPPRYKLLLSDIIASTEKLHPDIQPLKEASSAVDELCNHINECKRRKDIVDKYKAGNRGEVALSRLSMHSIRKKTQRARRKIGNYVGFANQFVDKDFDRETNYCKELEDAIKEFANNVDNVISSLKKSHDLQETVASDVSEYLSSPQPEEITLYLQAHQKISSTAFKLFKNDVDEIVLIELRKILALFQGPNKLIDKRGDKRLDYDAAQTKYERNKEDKLAAEELGITKRDFYALNNQLKEELPKFNHLVYYMFKDCVSEFTRLYRIYSEESYGLIFPSIEKTTLSGSTDVVDQFDKAYGLVESLVSELTSTRQTRKSSSKKSNASIQQTQTPDVRELLCTKYPSKLYVVTANHHPSDTMELALHQGDLIGVIQQKDPMGNDSRWYVDSGAGMGFIQRSHIRPYSTREGISDSGVSQQLQPTLIAQHLQQSPQTQQTPQLQPLQPEVFKSRYDFLSRNAQEMSLKANQIVYILEKHDKLGNRDWWYAQTSDGYGYVPANYLSPSNEI